MFKKCKTVLLSFVVIAGVIGGGLLTTVSTPALVGASAESQFTDGLNKVNSDNSKDLPKFIRNIINILLFLIGAVAVVMIVIGGFNYTISQGDQSKITSAKNTILYAVVGLVVAALAFAIVNFVVTGLF